MAERSCFSVPVKMASVASVEAESNQPIISYGERKKMYIEAVALGRGHLWFAFSEFSRPGVMA